MKKLFFKNKLQSRRISVSAMLEEPAALERLVEKLSCQRFEYDFESLDDQWQIVQTSSIEGYAIGNLVLSDENESINSIFDTCFIFTCVGKTKSNYKMTWACSLS